MTHVADEAPKVAHSLHEVSLFAHFLVLQHEAPFVLVELLEIRLVLGEEVELAGIFICQGQHQYHTPEKEVDTFPNL